MKVVNLKDEGIGGSQPIRRRRWAATKKNQGASVNTSALQNNLVDCNTNPESNKGQQAARCFFPATNMRTNQLPCFFQAIRAYDVEDGEGGGVRTRVEKKTPRISECVSPPLMCLTRLAV